MPWLYAEQDMPSHGESAASGLPGLEGFMAGRGDPYPGGGDCIRPDKEFLDTSMEVFDLMKKKGYTLPEALIVLTCLQSVLVKNLGELEANNRLMNVPWNTHRDELKEFVRRGKN